MRLGEVFRPFLKRSLTKNWTQYCAVKWCVFTAENMGIPDRDCRNKALNLQSHSEGVS